MPLSLLNHSVHALFAQRTRIPTSARSIGFCAIWVCISSSSSSAKLKIETELLFFFFTVQVTGIDKEEKRVAGKEL